MLAKSKKRTKGCVVILNRDLFGQNFLCQKLDPPPKKKKTTRDSLFFNKCCKRCQKQSKKPLNTHRTKTELTSLRVRGKIVQTRLLVSESKLFSLKQVFALATQVFIDQFQVTD